MSIKFDRSTGKAMDGDRQVLINNGGFSEYEGPDEFTIARNGKVEEHKFLTDAIWDKKKDNRE
jgi:hypothetical protein